MGENSNIQWTDHTFNPWIGCTKVSPGCANCYAESLMDTRYGRVRWGKGKPRQRTSAANWRLPKRWNNYVITPYGQQKHVEISWADDRRPRVFCASLADWLDDEVPIEWLADLLKLIHDTPNLDWLLLTKRPENWSDRLHEAMRVIHDETDVFISQWLDGDAPHNVWFGVSVEDQPRADERVHKLLSIPAKVHFVSAEPLLGPIDFNSLPGPDGKSALFALYGGFDGKSIDWIIVGGESGKAARRCEVEWIEDIVAQCIDNAVRVFVKQMGDNFTVYDHPAHLRASKGDDMAEWLPSVRVREFPAP